MIIEILAICLPIIVLLLPFCLWPIFIAMAVNKSLEILENKDEGKV